MAIFNALQYMFHQVRLQIPRPILDLGLNRDNVFNTNGRTLDDKLFQSVYLNKVKPDLDLSGSLPLKLPLRHCSIEAIKAPLPRYIITIPKHLTEWRSIISVKTLLSTFNLNSYTATSNLDRSPAVAYSRRIMRASDTVNLISTSRLEIIGDNKIFVEDPSIFPGEAILDCDIEHDEKLNTVNKKYWPILGDIMVNATKMFIRTNTIVELNEGYIKAGHEISIIKDEIEKYEDADEKYREAIEKWRGQAIMNNGRSKAEFIKSLIPNNI